MSTFDDATDFMNTDAIERLGHDDNRLGPQQKRELQVAIEKAQAEIEAEANLRIERIRTEVENEARTLVEARVTEILDEMEADKEEKRMEMEALTMQGKRKMMLGPEEE